MKSRKKAKIIILVLGIIFAISTISNQNFSDEQLNNDDSVEIRDETNLNSPKESGYWTTNFIHIQNDNWSENILDWIQVGAGTPGNPHVIENVTINAGGTGSGILIEDSNEYFIIRNCTVYNSAGGVYDAGIFLENTNNGRLEKNNCSNNNKDGVSLYNYCYNNIILNNIANDNLAVGIRLREYCDNNIISGNTANDNLRGMMLRLYCNNNTITGNSASNDGTTNQEIGIHLWGFCDNNTVSGNTANNNTDYGILLDDYCDNNTVSGNAAKDNTQHGIFLSQYCNNNTISGNTANNNEVYGIYLWTNCNDNTISGNTAGNDGIINQNLGIRLETNCDNNIILGNLFKNNLNWGILILSPGCSNNLIYHNSLIGTGGWHARDDGTNNHWNASAIGNYWDNHTSPDSDNDGIVDAPYTWIFNSPSSEDSFPLVESPVHLGEIIHIDDTGVSAWNWSKTAKLKAWCSGSGIESDPYIIDNLEIDGGGTGTGILIGNSSVYFVIKNCKIYNSGGGFYPDYETGIKLVNTNNGTLINNNCSNNIRIGIYLHSYCDSNTIMGNIVNNNTINGIYLRYSDGNTISGNTANDNTLMGIALDYSHYNNITGNTANDNDDYGIGIGPSDNNTISGNIADGNTQYGIFLTGGFNNTISGNIVIDNNIYGIYIAGDGDNNTIVENYIYFNADGAIYIQAVAAADNIIKRNVLVSNDCKFITDDGTNTIIMGNFFSNIFPSFVLEIIAQSFSTSEFDLTIKISCEVAGFGVSDLFIPIWWNGIEVPLNNIVELGNGLYNVSLTPIFVEPGGDPILLNMTISAALHTDKYFELKLAVDPEAVDKGPRPRPTFLVVGDDDDDDDEEQIEFLGPALIIVGITSVIGVAGIAIYLIRKRRLKLKR